MADSIKVNWQVGDLIGNGKHLDFSKPFLPESLAGVRGLTSLSAREKLLLNQIRGNSYLYLFRFVEEYILPFALDEARRATPGGDPAEVHALVTFAEEEAKHIHLFHRFGEEFKELLRHHWMEEAQHAKIDTLLVDKLAREGGPDAIAKAFEDFGALGGAVDGLLQQQVQLDLASLEAAAGRKLSDSEKSEITAAQTRAYRYRSWRRASSTRTSSRPATSSPREAPRRCARWRARSSASCS